MELKTRGSYGEDALSFSRKGTQRLTISLSEDFRRYFDDFKDKDLDIVIKPHREARSLNANALCWKLCAEIANVMRLSKEEVYLQALKDYGQSDVVSVRAGVDVAPYFKYFELMGTSSVRGKEFNHYKVYRGSSEYDREEMGILLDGIVQEAKSLEIPVWSKAEIETIKEAWGEECFTEKAQMPHLRQHGG